MNTGAGAYTATEAANASPLQTVEAAISQDEQAVQQAIVSGARVFRRRALKEEQLLQQDIQLLAKSVPQFK